MSQSIKPGAPKFFTKRNPQRPTLGGVVGEIVYLVRGYRFMPWQQYCANVAWELDPEHPGELYYSEGDISVPRQAGKSDYVEGTHIAGALMFADWSSSMTAQTGKAAGTRWQSLVKGLNLDVGTRAADWKIMRGKGAEQALYKRHRSTIEPFAPTEDALHGDHRNFVSIDEQWAFSIAEGIALETAAKPTMLTMKIHQLLRVSTMGTANSTYMNRNIELGRAATSDPGARRFYFEWSADEELADKDPYGDDTLAFHPAIGYTQSARRIRDLGRDMPLGDWRRSFLNLATQTSETIIDLALWDSLRWNYDPKTAGARYIPARKEDIVIAWDVARDGSSASIVAAWQQEKTSEPAIALVSTAPGTNWLPATLARLDRAGYRAILADDSGANRTIHQALVNDGVRTELINFTTYGTACQTFFDRVRAGKLEHDGKAIFSQQIAVATLKDAGKVRIIDAPNSAGAVDSLRAAAIAQDAAARILAKSTFQLF